MICRLHAVLTTALLPPSRRPAEESSLNEQHLDAAAARLCKARRVVAFTGAGISAESGISTYRDASNGNGVWDGFAGTIGMLLFGSKLGFMLLPRTAWRLYCERLLIPIAKAHPNAAHLALAELEAMMPFAEDGDCELPVITQNIDGLHQSAGSAKVVEIHGSCRTHRHAWTGMPIDVPMPPHPSSPPLLFTRPNVILFFEGMAASFWVAAGLVESLEEGDVMLLIGTSMAVAPANSLPYAALSNGCHVIEVNLTRSLEDNVPFAGYWAPGAGLDGSLSMAQPVVTFGSKLDDVHEHQTFLEGEAGTVLPQLVAKVRLRATSARQRFADRTPL